MSLNFEEVGYPIARILYPDDSSNMVYLDKDDDEGQKSITVDKDSVVGLIPAPENERISIYAPAGAGKTTLAANYAFEWKLEHPDQTIHLFTIHEDDPAYECVEHEEILVNETGFDINLDFKEIMNDLVIFDDMDNIVDKELKKHIFRQINSFMSDSRKYGVYTIFIGHLAMKGLETQTINNEANRVVLFNGVGSRQNLKYLKEYGSMETDEARDLVSLPDRWFCLSRNRPRYVVAERRIMML